MGKRCHEVQANVFLSYSKRGCPCYSSLTRSEHNIPLPDEYDVIHESLAPFHALSPSDLNARITLASQQEDTFMLKIKHGSIRTSVLDSAKIHGSDQRLAGQVDLVREVARHLPDLRAVWWLHDTPGVVVGWDHRRELMDLVEEGECE